MTRLETGEDAWAITLHEGSAEAFWRTLETAHQAGAPEIDWHIETLHNLSSAERQLLDEWFGRLAQS